MADTFKILDKDGNGKISKEEFLDGYSIMKKDLQKTKDDIEHEVDMLWGKIDIDGSFNLEYTEWALSTSNKEQLFTDKKVKQAFSLFDLDGSGKISLSELKKTMTPLMTNKLTDEDWKQMIMSIDEDGDGEINIREFKTLMTQTFNSLT